jgi:tyrosyl-tRNA synthetase
MHIYDFLKSRGFIYQITSEENFKKNFATGDSYLYAGFDLTAKSLHIGNLITIMILRHFQKFGFSPIVLLGGATTKVGDPSGKDKTREILDKNKIEENKDAIKKIFAKFLDIEKVIFVDNDEWISDYNYIDFLREVGSKFSVNQMLRFESVKQRLEREQNLSFLEFNYMILQAFDFVKLNEKYNCTLQVGGSDQWGNIVNGIELNRKFNEGQDDLIGLTTPLLLDSDGKKMGKTVGGAIWLDEELLSAYDYFQFFRNVTDDKVEEFLRFFTELDVKEIEELKSLQGQEINQAKEKLAFLATEICHGSEKAQLALETSQNVFQNHALDKNLPTIEINKTELENGIPFSLLMANCEIVETRGEAKRIIQGGGGKINDKAIKDPQHKISLKEFDGENQIKISAGKKRHALVKLL